jgi:hypothetical protein
MECAKCFGGVLAALTKQKATVFSAALMAIQYARNDSSSGYLFGVLEFLVTPRVRIPPCSASQSAIFVDSPSTPMMERHAALNFACSWRLDNNRRPTLQSAASRS